MIWFEFHLEIKNVVLFSSFINSVRKIIHEHCRGKNEELHFSSVVDRGMPHPDSHSRKDLLPQLLGVQSADSSRCQVLQCLPQLLSTTLPKNMPFPGEFMPSDSSLIPGHFSPIEDNSDGPCMLQNSLKGWPGLYQACMLILFLLSPIILSLTGVGPH